MYVKFPLSRGHRRSRTIRRMTVPIEISLMISACMTCEQAIESRTDQLTLMFNVLTIAYNRMPELLI
jgi:hypothetical protein